MYDTLFVIFRYDESDEFVEPVGVWDYMQIEANTEGYYQELNRLRKEHGEIRVVKFRTTYSKIEAMFRPQLIEVSEGTEVKID